MSELVNSTEELQLVESGSAAVEPVATPCADPNMPKVYLPSDGRNMSDFTSEVGRIMGPKKTWFLKGDTVVVVREVKLSEHVITNVFHPLTPAEVITAIEDHLLTGRSSRNDEAEEVFVRKSMGRETATALLASPQFKRELPRIDRILDVPVPYLKEGELVFARTGYDERLNTFCPALRLSLTPSSLEESRHWLHELIHDFCFADTTSATMAIARLITPMCRGLMGWSARPPVFIFEGNRPRAGKDCLAGCTTVLYEGHANEDAPLDSETEETVKRIGAALSSGRRFMHFANCKGHIDNGGFENASTAKVFSCRKLGSNDGSADLKLPNEVEFSISANTGFSFSEDFDLRCRKISLRYFEEDANSRTFSHPDLHGWILEHRQELLNALAGLVQYWYHQGCPQGPTAFTSFPEWAKVVGGILVACGLGDPCVAQVDGNMTTDTLTADMKRLFEMAYQERPDEWLNRNEVFQLVRSPDNDLFGWLDLEEHSGKTVFGLKLRQFCGRCLGGVYLAIDKHDPRRPKFRFTQEAPPVQENMATVVLGPNQEGKCQPCQPCQPLPPSRAKDNPLTEVPLLRCAGIKGDKATKGDRTEADKADSLAEQGTDVILQHDENGCPLPPLGIGLPELLALPVLDLRTRVERILDSADMFVGSPSAQSRCWPLPVYADRWDL
jgi:hypothetical protein